MPSPATRPATTRQRRKEARPHELLEAALELFAEKGFAGTRSEEVARRAGVSKGTLYLYYPSKEELFKAVIAHSLGARIADTAQQVQAWRGPMGPLLEEKPEILFDPVRVQYLGTANNGTRVCVGWTAAGDCLLTIEPAEIEVPRAQIRKDWSGVVLYPLSSGGVWLNDKVLAEPHRLKNDDRLALLAKEGSRPCARRSPRGSTSRSGPGRSKNWLTACKPPSTKAATSPKQRRAHA